MEEEGESMLEPFWSTIGLGDNYSTGTRRKQAEETKETTEGMFQVKFVLISSENKGLSKKKRDAEDPVVIGDLVLRSWTP